LDTTTDIASYFCIIKSRTITLFVNFLIILISSSTSHLFFFNDPATTEIYTLSLHDALPILAACIPHYPPDRRFGHENARREIPRSEEHTSELQSQSNLVCRLLLEKKKKKNNRG